MSAMRIAVLITVHNRAAVTAAGLSRFAELTSGLADEFTFEVFLVDDGSTDDTSSRVREIPLSLTITRGDGSLYWNRGMVLAYQTAVASGLEFDAYMLYNDDVFLSDEFISYLRYFRAHGSGILVGAFAEPGSDDVSYSGYRRLSRLRPLSFQRVELGEPVVPVDAFNGNLVLIPAAAFQDLGGLDPAYTHAYGDLDLGLRAKTIGVPSYVYGRVVGTCGRGVPLDDRLRSLGLRARWKLLFGHPHGLHSYLRFARKHCLVWLLPLYAASESLRRASKLVSRQA